MRYYFKALRNYFNINGRASRKELWMFSLFDFLFFIGFLCVDFFLGTTFTVDSEYGPYTLGYIGACYYFLFTGIPGVTLRVRRLHDVNRSGFWWLATYIPIVCIYPYCLLFFAESNPSPNKYGDVPENVRGYSQNVYVNINIDQGCDEQEDKQSNQNDSCSSGVHRVRVKRHRTAEQNQERYVYEENIHTDYGVTESPDSLCDDEFEAETEEKNSNSLSPLAIVFIVLMVVVSVVVVAYILVNTNNEAPQKEKPELVQIEDESTQIAEFLSDQNAGYASDRFHADTPLLRISMSDGEATFGVVRIYDTTYHLEVSGDSIEADWYDYYTRVSVIPKKKGISYINFSNELNDEEFQVMVVVY